MRVEEGSLIDNGTREIVQRMHELNIGSDGALMSYLLEGIGEKKHSDPEMFQLAMEQFIEIYNSLEEKEHRIGFMLGAINTGVRTLQRARSAEETP